MILDRGTRTKSRQAEAGEPLIRGGTIKEEGVTKVHPEGVVASTRAMANKTVGVTTLIEVTPQPQEEITTEVGAEVAIPLGLQSLLLVVREPNRLLV